MPDKIVVRKNLSDLDLEEEEDQEIMQTILDAFDDFTPEERKEMLREFLDDKGYEKRSDHEEEITIYDVGGIKAKTKDTDEDSYVDTVLSKRREDQTKSNAREVFTIERFLLFLCPGAFIEIEVAEEAPVEGVAEEEE